MVRRIIRSDLILSATAITSWIVLLGRNRHLKAISASGTVGAPVVVVLVVGTVVVVVGPNVVGAGAVA